MQTITNPSKRASHKAAAIFFERWRFHESVGWYVFLLKSNRDPRLKFPGGTNKEDRFANETVEETMIREVGEEVSRRIEIIEYIKVLEAVFPNHIRHYFLVDKAFGLPTLHDVTKNSELDESGNLIEELEGQWYPLEEVLNKKMMIPTQQEALEKAIVTMALVDEKFREDCGDLHVSEVTRQSLEKAK